jgi:magnesium and cobalt transporter
MDTEERALLLNLVKFGDLRVGDVMIPRADIIGLDVRSTIDVVIDVFQREFHSRIPIYREGLDHVIGMVHIKDLLKYWGKSDDFRLDDIVREVMFVPPSMPVADLLLNMRTRRVHMALVIDEYGGTDGLVTIEDLVEAIVGDIEDEHDDDEIDLIVEISEGVLEVDGRADSIAVEAKLHVDLLPAELDEEVETIAGVVASLAGRVPQRGEVISHPHGIEFEVLQADARRIKRLRITKVAVVPGATVEIAPQ